MKRAKNFFELVFYWLQRNVLISILLLVGVLYFATNSLFFNNSEDINLQTYQVVKKNLDEAVALTGTVKPAEEADLSFEKGGTVKNILVKVGDIVRAGDTLANLSLAQENSKVLEAKANLAAARSILSDLQTGSKTELVNIKQAAVTKSVNDLEQAYKNTGDSIRNIGISGNSFVRDNLSVYFTGNIAQGFTINVNSCDSQRESKINQLRSEAEKSLLEIEKISDNYKSFNTTTQRQTADMVKDVHSVKITEYLNSLKDLFSLNCLTNNSSYDTVRTTITSSRNSWSSLNADLSIKINTIDNFKTALDQAQNELQLSQSGEKSQKLDQQNSQILAAQARLEAAQAEYDKNILVAPFDGIITDVIVKKGEQVTQGEKSISVISTSNFQIESKVSEVDVAKISVNNKAAVSFDAYGDQTLFNATILNISPAGIISEGVPTYKTIFSFDNKDERVKSGMTANIRVITAMKSGVVSVPAKFIQNKNGQKFVNVVNSTDSSDFVERDIKTGVIGVNGEVEILEGLTGSEKIVIKK